LQSLYAIGSGGVFGLGLGKSRQKYLYLPFQHNDYIFAIVCEELGLLGALVIVALFAVTIIRGYWIALHARDRFSTVLCAGLVTLIAVQTILNFCVVTNLLPSTGIALPFFSYGGTALAMNLAEMGVVMSISRYKDQPKLQEVPL
jgi:cell division protein FtsW